MMDPMLQTHCDPESTFLLKGHHRASGSMASLQKLCVIVGTTVLALLISSSSFQGQGSGISQWAVPSLASTMRTTQAIAPLQATPFHGAASPELDEKLMQNMQVQDQHQPSSVASFAKRLGRWSAATFIAAAAFNGPAFASDVGIPVMQPTELTQTTQAGVEATLGVKVQTAPQLVDTTPILAAEQSEEVPLAVRGEEFCAPASFAVLFITMMLYWIQAAYYPKSETLKKISYAGMLTSNLLLAALLSFRWVSSGHFPMSNLYESLMFLSWGISTVPLALERQVAYGVSTGAIFAPLVLMINAFATLILPPELQRASALVPALKSNWLMMHVSVMMMSYAVLLAGSVMAMAYLFVTRNDDDSKAPTQNPSSGELPAAAPADIADIEAMDGLIMTLDGTAVQGAKAQRTLAETLDDLSYRTLVLGFPLLTIGIISGAVWANEAWGSYWSWDPKETWALITWLVYSFYLHTRLNKGWKGKTSALVGASGFVVVWICYIGVNLFGVGLHSYGFFSQG